VDSSDKLWAVERGQPRLGQALISGWWAKLWQYDLPRPNARQVTIVLPDSLITKGTSINDVPL